MENERNQCRKCGGQGKPSKAIMNFHNIRFPHDGSKAEFETKLLDCIKCTSCGHSWIPVKYSKSLHREWWNSIKNHKLKQSLADDLTLTTGQRAYQTLTDREIEDIWRKETQELLYENQSLTEKAVYTTKPNQKQYTQEEVDRLLDKQAAETTAQVLKNNQKHFKEFSPELSSAYLNKFDDKGKVEFFEILINKLSDEDKLKCLRFMVAICSPLTDFSHADFENSLQDFILKSK